MSRHRFFVPRLASAASLALVIAAGCSDDTSPATNESTTHSGNDGAGGTSTPGSSTATDAGAEASLPTTSKDTGAPPPTGCGLYPDADFCDDFDSADALTAGKTKWDFLEPTDQPVLGLATDRAVSAPSSLLSRIVDGTTPGAKFAKTITKSGFTKVRWDYDIYLDAIGTTDGFFLDDFQFSDAVGADTWGFRLVMFAKESGLDFVRVEHNADAAGGPYVLEDALPAGTVALGKWMHFTQEVDFTFASGDAGDAGANTAVYTLSIDGAQAFAKTYAGLTRERAAFARIAGLAYVFNKANSAGLAIHWDNQALALK